MTIKELLVTEIKNLEVERVKLVKLHNEGAMCDGINAIDAVISAKKATLVNLNDT